MGWSEKRFIPIRTRKKRYSNNNNNNNNKVDKNSLFYGPVR